LYEQMGFELPKGMKKNTLIHWSTMYNRTDITKLLLEYGANPNVDWYGAGGGSIYNIDTFLDNYHKIYDFLDFEFDYILKYMDHRFGWLDLYMQIAYFVCGKDYSINTNLTETWKTPNFRETDFSLVHAYKELY